MSYTIICSLSNYLNLTNLYGCACAFSICISSESPLHIYHMYASSLHRVLTYVSVTYQHWSIPSHTRYI